MSRVTQYDWRKAKYVTYIQIRQFCEDFWLFYPRAVNFHPLAFPVFKSSQNTQPICRKYDSSGRNWGLFTSLRQGDEMKHSSGVSQSRRGDEQFVILQYSQKWDHATEWYKTYQITWWLAPCTDFKVENLIYKTFINTFVLLLWMAYP